MLTTEMKNHLYRFLKEHAKTVLPNAKAVQKVLNKLPKKFDSVKVVLSANAVASAQGVEQIKFNDVVLVNGDKKFAIQTPFVEGLKFVVKPLAQSIGFDLRDLNVTKLDEKMFEAVSSFENCLASGVGSTIEIQKKEIILKSQITMLGECVEMVIIFDENNLK